MLVDGRLQDKKLLTECYYFEHLAEVSALIQRNEKINEKVKS